MIDAQKTTYTIKAFLPSGETLDLTKLAEGLTWSELDGELAQRAQITLANIQIKEGFVNALLALCVRIEVYANGKTVFSGTIWEQDYTSAREKTIKILCYDRMIYLTRSEGHYYYTAGKDTGALIADQCSAWGVMAKYESKPYTHPKVLFKGSKISDNIVKLVKEADKKTGAKSVIIFQDGALVIKERGQNEAVYVFKADKNVLNTNYQITMDNLVTKVVIYGKENKDGRASVQATVTGKTEYGILQKTVYRDGDKTLGDAKQEAQSLLADYGIPQETITVEAADVPFMRKGDKVKILAGNLSGYFYVKGITHDGGSRTMLMDLER